MNFVDIEPLARKVMARVPGLPLPLAVSTVRDVATDFCRQTKASQETAEPQDLVGGKNIYDLEAPSSDVEVDLVLAATANNHPLRPLPSDWRPERPNLEGAPRFYLPLYPSEVQLYPTPSTTVASGLVLYLSYVPSPDAERLDYEVARRWEYALVIGAVSRLRMDDTKPWANPNMAVQHEREYYDFLSRARALAMRGKAGGPMQVRPNPLI